MKAIINGKIVTQEDILENKVLVFNEYIVGIENNLPLDCEVIDAKGFYVCPGLIDVHIHGSCGADTMDTNIEAVRLISEGISKNGVTSFLPTTMTMSKTNIYQALNNVRYWMYQELQGAKVLGAHLEGPFINQYYKGAQPAEHILEANYDFIDGYKDVIKILTYAPELDKNYQFTKEIKQKTDITLSMGHTGAKFTEMKTAFEYGCSHVTHLFNAMTPLNHRELGAVGSALTSPVFCEVIADKIHINSQLFQFILNNKGVEKVVLITDSMKAGCMQDGIYDLGGQSVIVKDGAVRLECGNLAGSVLTLNRAVKNFYDNTNATLPQVIQMASLNPAKSIGMNKFKGSLEVGKDADIVLFDEDLNCHLTICEGREIFKQL